MMRDNARICRNEGAGPARTCALLCMCCPASAKSRRRAFLPCRVAGQFLGDPVMSRAGEATNTGAATPTDVDRDAGMGQCRHLRALHAALVHLALSRTV